MRRDELFSIIQNCVLEILKNFSQRNFIQYKEDIIFSCTEIYRTSNIVGDITFQLEPNCDIESELSEKDLNALAQHIINNKYREYIYTLKFKKVKETEYIDKIVLKINFKNINEYISDLCNNVFLKLGYKDYKTFLDSFRELSFKYLIDEVPKVYRTYKINGPKTSFHLRIENQSLVSIYKEILEHFMHDSSIICLDSARNIFEYNWGSGTTFITFYKSHGTYNIRFETHNQYKTEGEIDKILSEESTVGDKTFKFVIQEG